MAKYDIHIIESLPGVLGNRGNDIYSRGTGNKCQILSGTWYEGNIGEHGTKENNFRFLKNRETSLFISGEQGNGYPLGGSHKHSNFQAIHQFVGLFIRLSTRHTLY